MPKAAPRAEGAIGTIFLLARMLRGTEERLRRVGGRRAASEPLPEADIVEEAGERGEFGERGEDGMLGEEDAPAVASAGNRPRTSCSACADWEEGNGAEPEETPRGRFAIGAVLVRELGSTVELLPADGEEELAVADLLTGGGTGDDGAAGLDASAASSIGALASALVVVAADIRLASSEGG